MEECHRNVTARAGASCRQSAHHRPNLAHLCASRRQLATPQWLCKQEVTGSIPVGSMGFCPGFPLDSWLGEHVTDLSTHGTMASA